MLIGSRNTLRECILSRRDELLSAFQGEEEDDNDSDVDDDSDDSDVDDDSDNSDVDDESDNNADRDDDRDDVY